MKKLMFSVFALAAFGFGASAEISNNANGDGRAVLLSAILLENTQDLVFGQIFLGTGIGTATLAADPTGTLVTESMAGTNYIMLDGLARSAAKFTVSGTANASYEIQVPSSPIILTATDGSAGVEISSFNASSETGILSASGVGDFYIGGVLTIPDATIAGNYKGTFNVTVAYN